jgi:hypothetical protein
MLVIIIKPIIHVKYNLRNINFSINLRPLYLDDNGHAEYFRVYRKKINT